MIRWSRSHRPSELARAEHEPPFGAGLGAGKSAPVPFMRPAFIYLRCGLCLACFSALPPPFARLAVAAFLPAPSPRQGSSAVPSLPLRYCHGGDSRCLSSAANIVYRMLVRFQARVPVDCNKSKSEIRNRTQLPTAHGGNSAKVLIYFRNLLTLKIVWRREWDSHHHVNNCKIKR